jgi:hypothetical protein
MNECRITDGARDLRAYLTEQRLSVPAFCERHGFDRIQVQRVLLGQRWRRITVDFAHAIEVATNGRISWQRWLSRTSRRAPVRRAA